MPPKQARFKDWMQGAAIAVVLILAALAFAEKYGGNAATLEDLKGRVVEIEKAKLGERLAGIESTLHLIVRGLGLRPVP